MPELKKYYSFLQDTASSFTPLSWFLPAAATIAITLFLIIYLKKKNSPAGKAKTFIALFISGLTGIRRVKSPWALAAHSFLIWLLFFSASYYAFYSFPPARELSFYFAALAVTAGSLSKFIPVPGHIGAYHGIIIYTFILFGHPREWGELMALLIHSSQALMVIGLCPLYLWLLLKNQPSVRGYQTSGE